MVILLSMSAITITLVTTEFEMESPLLLMQATYYFVLGLLIGLLDLVEV